ncbi:proteasome subunit beta type-7-A-like [Camellia sinensis]|uniref:proteasome subunit beta type-7-A-like n=1 Tax=Camellia sinensis TaxID=4442 RepID=UPI0010362DA9|nr:proteasome subunit beta type-7-A-like [Camellia sinensis]
MSRLQLTFRAAADVPLKGGFSFDLCRRNEMLSKKSVQAPKFLKTGTTIVGLIFQDGVILLVNTRATEGPIVADKNCEKIHFTAVEQALLLIQRQ